MVKSAASICYSHVKDSFLANKRNKDLTPSNAALGLRLSLLALHRQLTGSLGAPHENLLALDIFISAAELACAKWLLHCSGVGEVSFSRWSLLTIDLSYSAWLFLQLLRYLNQPDLLALLARADELRELKFTLIERISKLLRSYAQLASLKLVMTSPLSALYEVL